MRFMSLCAVLMACAISLAYAAEPLPLVEKGKSPYTIYIAKGSPESVKDAATELQRVVQLSTDLTLKISNTPTSPMIALGDSPSALKAGLVGSKMPFEGFRIETKGKDVFIVGHDTMEGKEKWNRHISRGTYFGTCVFLEKVVNVRWLMPGEIGEDIPQTKTIRVPEMVISQKPGIRFRSLAYIQNRGNKVVNRWQRRNRTHEWYRVSFGHSFDEHPSLETLKKHPEYMPMRSDGTRQPVPTDMKKNHKYCLTNKGLIKDFGDSVVHLLKERRPNNFHTSLSLSDGARFCECLDCKAKVIRNDGGKWGNFAERGWSMTPAVLDFYNGIARIVRKECPNRIVGGLMYHAYTYPPDKVTRLEPNLVLNVAVLDHYGFKLYKPSRMAEFKKLYPAWHKFTDKVAVTDYSTWMRDWYGLPIPPGRELMKEMFKAYGKYTTFFVNYTGHAAWGTGGIHNYMAAKLMWDPKLDVDKLYKEFLVRAYGKDAAPYMDKIWRISEKQIAAYVNANPGFRNPSYDASYELVADYYAPKFAEFESLYKKAMAATKTDKQRKRLAMFGDAMILLHYNLRCAKLVKNPEKSMFYKSHEDFQAWVKSVAGSLSIAPHQKGTDGRKMRILFAKEDRALQIPQLVPDVSAPKIDGKLNDSAWSRAAKATNFRLRGTKIDATQQTIVRITFDEKNLYVAAHCKDAAMDKIKMATKSHDSTGLFSDDTLELFIGHKQVFAKTYWHLAINPAGGTYDNVALDKDYDLRKLKKAVTRDKDGWTVELAIPFRALGERKPPIGKTWHGNFGRIRKPKPVEVSTWAGVEDSFHEPKSFGKWKFVGN
jgi:Domain of unknown function (DUF4838)/Carbohydrate family 9 binding domain-like